LRHAPPFSGRFAAGSQQKGTEVVQYFWSVSHGWLLTQVAPEPVPGCGVKQPEESTPFDACWQLSTPSQAQSFQVFVHQLLRSRAEQPVAALRVVVVSAGFAGHAGPYPLHRGTAQPATVVLHADGFVSCAQYFA
jgi:hypothetical protein